MSARGHPSSRVVTPNTRVRRTGRIGPVYIRAVSKIMARLWGDRLCVRFRNVKEELAAPDRRRERSENALGAGAIVGDKRADLEALAAGADHAPGWGWRRGGGRGAGAPGSRTRCPKVLAAPGKELKPDRKLSRLLLTSHSATWRAPVLTGRGNTLLSFGRKRGARNETNRKAPGAKSTEGVGGLPAARGGDNVTPPQALRCYFQRSRFTCAVDAVPCRHREPRRRSRWTKPDFTRAIAKLVCRHHQFSTDMGNTEDGERCRSVGTFQA
jgi:hypothetical protein